MEDVVDQLSNWGRLLHRKFRDEVQRCKSELERLRFCDDVESVALYEKTRADLSKLLLEEELFWKQRAKVFWLQGGDQNTKVFHAVAFTRLAKNRIKKLRDANGVIHDSHPDMCSIALNYFTDLFTAALILFIRQLLMYWSLQCLAVIIFAFLHLSPLLSLGKQFLACIWISLPA